VCQLKMRSASTGQLKEVPVGFSWTTLCFGGLPALFRGDWKHFLLLGLFGPLTLGVVQVVYAFKYNTWYTTALIGRGYKVVMSREELAFMSLRMGVQLPLFYARPGDVLPRPRGSMFPWLFPLAMVLAMARGMTLGYWWPTLSEPWRAAPESALAVTSTQAGVPQPPEPLQLQALNLLKSALIEDFLLHLHGESSVFAAFAPAGIAGRRENQQLAEAYDSDTPRADATYAGRTWVVTGSCSRSGTAPPAMRSWNCPAPPSRGQRHPRGQRGVV
jgi:hypothetical protein